MNVMVQLVSAARNAYLVGAVALAFGCLSVKALPTMQFSDSDSIGQRIDGQSYTGTFNIATGDGGPGDVAGFNPAVWNITSATASFVISVNANKTGSVQVTLDGNSWNSGSGNAFTVGGLITGSFLADLQSDGILTYVVSLTPGTQDNGTHVTLESASLVVNAVDPPGVPDGGMTLLLLGAAFSALGMIRRTLR
jgi:hypothetical protein